jgi:hypothetical protein
MTVSPIAPAPVPASALPVAPVPTPPVAPPTPPVPVVPPAADPPADQGFPPATPVKDMTPVEQAAYWKAQSRKHEDRASHAADYDTIKAERDALKTATLTDAEKAIEAAKTEARTAAMVEAAKGIMPKLVRAEFKAAATGKIEPDRLTAILEPLDLTKFLTADGSEVDADKVSAYVAGIAGGAGKTWPDMGQGRRGTTDKPTGVGAGRSLYEQRHVKK